MKSPRSQEKYLEVLRLLNVNRRVVYRRMTRSLSHHLQKLFSKLSMDSLSNANEIKSFIDRRSTHGFTSKHSFEPFFLLKSLQERKGDLFDHCREAEWRLLRFYEELIDNPEISLELRSVLSNQRDKVMLGYERLNMLSRNPW